MKPLNDLHTDKLYLEGKFFSELKSGHSDHPKILRPAFLVNFAGILWLKSTIGIQEICILYEGLTNVCYLQFRVLWAQERSSKVPNRTSGFKLSSYSILYSYIKPTPHPPPLKSVDITFISLTSTTQNTKAINI